METKVWSVSYTHLDVYKRQGMSRHSLLLILYKLTLTLLRGNYHRHNVLPANRIPAKLVYYITINLKYYSVINITKYYYIFITLTLLLSQQFKVNLIFDVTLQEKVMRININVTLTEVN